MGQQAGWGFGLGIIEIAVLAGLVVVIGVVVAVFAVKKRSDE